MLSRALFDAAFLAACDVSFHLQIVGILLVPARLVERTNVAESSMSFLK